MHATGEQVDLLTFPPVCLPSEGDNFDGSDGVVAGSQFLFAGFFVSFLFSKDGVWQSHMVTFLLKFFMMSRWGFHLMLFSFLNSYCKQIPIIGKADCEKNMEENGNTFTEGLLCAGGNRKGSCKVQTHSLSKTLSNSIDLKTLSNISSGWQRRSLDYRRWGFGWSCQCRRSRSVCEGEVLFYEHLSVRWSYKRNIPFIILTLQNWFGINQTLNWHCFLRKMCMTCTPRLLRTWPGSTAQSWRWAACRRAASFSRKQALKVIFYQ